jgi:excisionase family DNA binding protein
MNENHVLLPLPDSLVAVIADRAAALVLEHLERHETAPASPYMTIREASEYLRCSRQRIDDLLSQKRLERLKDGSRTLIRRSDLDRYLGLGRRR